MYFYRCDICGRMQKGSTVDAGRICKDEFYRISKMTELHHPFSKDVCPDCMGTMLEKFNQGDKS